MNIKISLNLTCIPEQVLLWEYFYSLFCFHKQKYEIPSVHTVYDFNFYILYLYDFANIFMYES